MDAKEIQGNWQSLLDKMHSRWGEDLWIDATDLMVIEKDIELIAAPAGQQEPALKVYRGEICYKSTEDDQSYGMWCPVDQNHSPEFPEGTEFYKSAPAGEPTVEQSIQQLVKALQASKGWMRDYADAIIRDAIDRKHLKAPADDARDAPQAVSVGDEVDAITERIRLSTGTFTGKGKGKIELHREVEHLLGHIALLKSERKTALDAQSVPAWPFDDRAATQQLRGNFTCRAGLIQPKQGYELDDADKSAIDYLCAEWDYAYDPTPASKGAKTDAQSVRDAALIAAREALECCRNMADHNNDGISYQAADSAIDTIDAAMKEKGNK